MDYFIYINSKDRYLRSDDDKTFNFKVSFSDSVSTTSAGVTRILKNIKEIEITDIIIPNFYTNLIETHFLYTQSMITSETSGSNSRNLITERLRDLPYIIIKIDEIKNDLVIGTNNQLNKSTFAFKLDHITDTNNKNSGLYQVDGSSNYVEVGNINNNIVADVDSNKLHYKSIGEAKINLSEHESPRLLNINLSLRNPMGNVLKYMNDSLTISTITVNTTTNKLLLNFTEFFSSEEYPLGSRILINNINITSSTSTTSWSQDNFSTFLTRNGGDDIDNAGYEWDKQGGHIVVGHFGVSENNELIDTNDNSKKTKLFKSLYIAFPFKYNSLVTDISEKRFSVNNFGLSNSSTITCDSANRVINLSNQILISMRVKCEK